MKSKPKAPKKTAARAPRRAREEDFRDPDDDDSDDELDELEAGDDVELQHAAEELQGGGDGGSIRVKKLEPKEEAGDCDSYPVSIWPDLTEQLRADWGDGKYALTLRRANGQIAARGIRQLARRPTKPTPAIDPLQAQRTAREELQAQMAPMMQMMQSAFSALVGRPAPAAQDPLVMLETLARLQKMSDRGDGGHKSFLEGLQFARELGGTGDREPGLADLAIKFLDRLPRDMTAPGLPPPAAPANGAAPAPPPQEQTQMQVLQRAIAAQIPVLLRGAAQDSDPAVYAQLILDQVPEAFLAIITQELTRPDWWDRLQAIAPDVRVHNAWFVKLRDEVLQALSAPVDPAG